MIPPAIIGPSIGMMQPEIVLKNRFQRLSFLISFISSLLMLPSPEICASRLTSLTTSLTCVPMITWYCPP